MKKMLTIEKDLIFFPLILVIRETEFRIIFFITNVTPIGGWVTQIESHCLCP